MKIEHDERADSLDDAALVTAAQHDQTAFGQLYERYVDSVYRSVYRQVGNHVAAEDLTAQTFQHARAALPDFTDQDAPFGAWLMVIAQGLIDERAQPLGKDAEGTRSPAVPAESIEGGGTFRPAQADDSGALLAAVRQLPLEQQRAIVLKFARTCTSREIGDALNLSEPEAKQLVYRALVALRTALESK